MGHIGQPSVFLAQLDFAQWDKNETHGTELVVLGARNALNAFCSSGKTSRNEFIS